LEVWKHNENIGMSHTVLQLPYKRHLEEYQMFCGATCAVYEYIDFLRSLVFIIWCGAFLKIVAYIENA
jgi:hypothetical protein